MLWIMQFSGFFSAAMVMIVLSPSLQSFPPAEAIRSSHLDSYLRLPSYQVPTSPHSREDRFLFRKASEFRNADKCGFADHKITGVCDPSLVHVAITLDVDYLRGSIAAVHSILQHSLCPENFFFHFLVSETNLETLVRCTFPHLKFKVYYFDPEIVRNLISSSVRQALEQPLNYARNYLADLLEPCVRRVIYLDSDLVVVDDISKLWSTNLGSRTIGAPEYCHANFTKYFTGGFWSEERFSGTFKGRKPCYFNTGVMVIDLLKWRRFGYTKRIERWMEIQKIDRIYELGSLPPFLLVFAGRVAPIDEALAIATTMPKLKQLEVAYLRITTEGVLKILENCPELELLDVRGCWNVKLDENFVKKFSRLKVVGPHVVDYSGMKGWDDCSNYSSSSGYLAWDFVAVGIDFDDEISFGDWEDDQSMEDVEMRFYDGFDLENAAFDWPPSP